MEHHLHYDSIEDAAKVAVKHINNGNYKHFNRRFAGTESVKQVEKWAVDGFSDGLPDVMDIAESAIETVAAEHDMPSFASEWSVAGCEVDVARYLSGQPENMIEYVPVKTPRHGRVITLCSSVAASAAISRETIMQRGHAVVALALAINRMGLATELWVDWSASTDIAGRKNRGDFLRMRVLVKGANDELDPARIMFAFAHPAMLRAISFPNQFEAPEWWLRECEHNAGYPANPKEDLPEGTLYLPCVLSSHDVPDADVALMQYLRELEIVE